jgi:hypothetical protein
VVLSTAEREQVAIAADRNRPRKREAGRRMQGMARNVD